MPYRHRVGTYEVRTYPPIATIYIEFFFCGNMGVVFVRQSVHLADHFFSTTQFQHGFSEPCITNEPIVNAQELSFLTLLLELIRSVVFLITFFLPVPVTLPWTRCYLGTRVHNFQQCAISPRTFNLFLGLGTPDIVNTERDKARSLQRSGHSRRVKKEMDLQHPFSSSESCRSAIGQSQGRGTHRMTTARKEDSTSNTRLFASVIRVTHVTARHCH